MRELKQFFNGAKKSEISSTSKNRRFLVGFNKGMKNFGHNLALIINSILLSVVYLIGVGITSIFAKLFKKHFLDMKLLKRDSYWSDLDLKKKPIKEYYRQF